IKRPSATVRGSVASIRILDVGYLSHEGRDLFRSRTGSSSCWLEKDQGPGRP
ncbi:hypothetical protein NDU88_004292, partial [Pleurodeles waltl]